MTEGKAEAFVRFVSLRGEPQGRTPAGRYCTGFAPVGGFCGPVIAGKVSVSGFWKAVSGFSTAVFARQRPVSGSGTPCQRQWRGLSASVGPPVSGRGTPCLWLFIQCQRPPDPCCRLLTACQSLTGPPRTLTGPPRTLTGTRRTLTGTQKPMTGAQKTLTGGLTDADR